MAGDSYYRPLKGMHKVIILVTQTTADILTSDVCWPSKTKMG